MRNKSAKKISDKSIIEYESDIERYKVEIEDQLKYIEEFEIDTTKYTKAELINNTVDGNIKKSIIDTIKNEINLNLFTLNSQIKASSSGLQEIKETLEDKKEGLSKEIEKISQWLWSSDSNKEEEKWSITSKIIFSIVIILIFISCFSEIVLSYYMLTTNTISFAETPSYAIIVGIIVIVFSLGFETIIFLPYSKIPLQYKKIILPIIFLAYIMFHFVIYDMQSITSSISDEDYLSAIEDNDFNSENIFYSIISFFISFSIVVFITLARYIHDKNRANKNENKDWIELNNSIEDIESIFPKIASAISLLPNIEENIQNKTEYFCSKAKLEINSIIGQYEESKRKNEQDKQENNDTIIKNEKEIRNLEESLKEAKATLENKKASAPENKEIETAEKEADKIEKEILDLKKKRNM